MKMYVTAIRQGQFRNDAGEEIHFAKIQVMNDAHEDSERVKGRRCDDYNAAHDLIKTVEAKNLPGWYDAELALNNGKAVVVSLKHNPAPGSLNPAKVI